MRILTASISIIICALLLSGCLSPTYINHRIKAQIESASSESNGKTKTLMPMIEDSRSEFIEDDIVLIRTTLLSEGVSVTIKNKSNTTIEVVWDKCAFIDIGGESRRVIHGGIKLIDRNTAAQPNSMIAPGSKITDSITPADNIHWVSGYSTAGYWNTLPLIDKPKPKMYSDEQFLSSMKIATIFSGSKVSGVIAIKSGDELIYYKLNYRLDMELATGNFEMN